MCLIALPSVVTLNSVYMLVYLLSRAEFPAFLCALTKGQKVHKKQGITDVCSMLLRDMES